MNKNITKVVNNTLNSLYVKSVIAKRGWTVEYARVMIVDYLTCGNAVSLYDFLEAA